MANLAAKVRALEKRAEAIRPSEDLSRYARHPRAYAAHVLKVKWWKKQRLIARLLTVPPYRVLAKACHEVGKTYVAGGLVNWWYDVHNPGLVLTTAPNSDQVKDLLWKEVRAQRGSRGGFRGPRMPRLQSSDRHWAHGFTARDSTAFQGRHEEHVLVIFDEAVGVDPVFWEAAENMWHAWLAIFNPTDQSSQAYQEERTQKWHVVEMSALEHPNIIAELAGKPAPYKAAIHLGRLDRLLKKWSSPVTGEPRPGDVEWPPGSGKWLRPGPQAESRLLGRWPSLGIDTVWSESVWNLAEKLLLEAKGPVEIGCDVARFGDDFTEIHVKQGRASLHHEAHNGWKTTQTAGRLKQLCNEWGKKTGQPAKRIKVKIDDVGVGGGVVDLGDDFNFIGINAASTDCDQENYPNLRSELWFAVAKAAADGFVSFARLPEETMVELRKQALAPRYTLNERGQLVVEPKDMTKAGSLKRSPDGMDAVNLAYCHVDQDEDEGGGRLVA